MNAELSAGMNRLWSCFFILHSAFAFCLTVATVPPSFTVGLAASARLFGRGSGTAPVYGFNNKVTRQPNRQNLVPSFLGCSINENENRRLLRLIILQPQMTRMEIEFCLFFAPLR
jgi:hypothetical protein